MTFLGYKAADPRIVRLRSSLTEDQILDFDKNVVHRSEIHWLQ